MTELPVNQKEYLKKYLAIGKAPGEKKRKKKKVTSNKVQIIDDDVITYDVETPIDEDVLLVNEDAPQIVAIIDERPPSMRIDEKTKNPLWQPIGTVNHSADTGQKQMIKGFKIEPKSNDILLAHSDRSPPRRHKRRKDDHSPSKKRDDNLLLTDIVIKEERQSVERSEDGSPPRRNRNSSEDRSPRRNREKRNEDNSPSRKRREDKSPPRRRIDEDISPPRRRGNEDNSPQRRRGNGDNSPPRRRGIEDNSPPRRRIKEQNSSPKRNREMEKNSKDNSRKNSRWDNDNSPPRKNRRVRDNDNSPPRRNRRDEDFSPPRRKQEPTNRALSPKRFRSPKRQEEARNNRRRSPVSPPIRIKREERSEERSARSSKMQKTLDGKTAGLQNARELIEETRNFHSREDNMFKSLTKDVSGENANTVHRERGTGKIRNLAEEEERQKKKREEEEKNKEKYERWGRGLAQVESREQQLKDQLHEMSKPLARYADDEDLEKYLKEQEREGDPMLAYIRKKKKKKAVEAGEVFKPQFEGEFMPNRYGIRPGHRWDGVDRGNGYEKKWFEIQNEKRAQQEESYKWSTEDM